MATTQPTVIKVVALCGSLRQASYNRGLIRSGNALPLPALCVEFSLCMYAIDQSSDYIYTAMEICQESINGMEIEYVDISPLPFLNTDLEVDGTFPPEVEEFRRKILGADSVLFASPEYNFSVAGTYYHQN